MDTSKREFPKISPEMLLGDLENLIADFQLSKPNDRSDKDRIYAMVISDLQKAAALFDRHVVRAQ